MDRAESSSIYYQCQRCANCCKWPGEVLVSDREVVAIARHLELPVDEFIRDYTQLRKNRQGLTLIDKSNGECIFLEGIQCRINPVKPEQCRDFPNKWNFPGWQQVCEAIPVPVSSRADAD